MIPPKPFRRALLNWYDRNKRDLPWRKDQDPYRVLVSELMLQQTQVKTVLPYYGKFLKKFPSVEKLAAASEQELLASWAGLGYYRRARFLQAAAAAVAQSGFPRSDEGLRALPGIGAYTAAAVGSICFSLPLAVVDGNVIRVLSRLMALELDAKSPQGQAAIQAAAAELLDEARPGDYNQAVMELGALVCSARSPDCAACPVSKFCSAFSQGRIEEFPRLPAQPRATRLRKAVALVEKGDAVLCAPRSGKGRMVGLWHFPEAEIGASEDASARAARLARAACGGAPRALGKCGALSHTVTRYRISLEAYRFSARSAPRGPWRWMGRGALKRLPLASAEKRLLAMLEGPRP